MRFKTDQLFILVPAILALALFACSDDDSKGDPDAGSETPEPICLDPGAEPFDLTFTDVTSQVGLDSIGDIPVQANSVVVVDIDGDHWPDLSLSRQKSLREDPSAREGYYFLMRNQGDGTFADHTFESGLYTTRSGEEGRATSRILFGDVDNDGDRDAFSIVFEDADNSVEDHTSVFFNDGVGNFDIGPEQSFTSGMYDSMTTATFLDYDRDGHLDVFTGHHYGQYGYLTSTVQDSLFAGDGQGGFDDVTDSVGLTTVSFNAGDAASGTTHKPTWGVNSCDVDGDGWVDLMTNSYGRQLNAFYRNTGASFEDLTLTSGHGSDQNEDYTDNFMFLCYCQYHPSDAVCDGITYSSPSCGSYQNNWSTGYDDQNWRLGGNSGVSVCGDVDNDGDMDIMTAELAHSWAGQSSDRSELLINDDFPNNPLVRPGNDVTGLARPHSGSDWNEGDMGALLADFDNDGQLDIVIASSDYPMTYSLIWQQNEDGTFEEIGGPAGVQIMRSHGAGMVDYDRDGDYDLIFGTSLMRWSATDNPPAPDAEYVYLLRNNTGQDANKLMFHLRGAGGNGNANGSAIGARVTVEAGGNTYTREVSGGYGLGLFQEDDLLIIGIGANCTADKVTIRWPNENLSEVVLEDVLANYVIVLEEGQEMQYQSLEEYTSGE